MSSTATRSKFLTMADLLEQLGRVSPRRVRLHPMPGKATEQDVIAIQDRTGRLYELVNGTLVEKVMGYPESSLAFWLGYLLQMFLDEHDLGNLAGPDGALRLMPGLVRIPDISFIRWERFPNREVPDEPIAGLAPDLAVEILSRGNTKTEMQRKLREYFFAGVRQVWLVDTAHRTVQVYTAPDQCVVLTEDQTLDGGDVLPGLKLPLRKVFARTPHATRRSARTTRQPAKRKKNGSSS
jgi:Uma2 family endonuclease